MMHRWTSLLLVATLACGGNKGPTTSTITSEPTAAPNVPAAPVATGPTAEQQFVAWLDAFNAGDRAKLAAAAKNMSPELQKELGNVDELLGFKEQVGGFDLKKTEESTDTKFVGVIKERAGDQFARAIVETAATPQRTLQKLDLKIIPVPDDLRPARLTEAAAIDALKAELDKLVAEDKFSGAVVVAKQGKPIFAQAYGKADRAKQVANTVDTRFRIGSMNKMFTAVATLQLVQAGKLALDGTIDKYLPDYPNKTVASKVTIHHLLTHSGGTGDIFGPEFEKNQQTLKTLDDYVKLYGNRELTHEPGAKMQYSNYGFLLLGVIVARVSKQSYYDRVAATIFKPAGMKSTESPVENPTKPIAGRSIPYTKFGDNDKPLPDWSPAFHTLPVRATSAGGGDSTVNDLLKFANALKAHKLLDAKHTELLTTGKIESGGGKYAYGFVDVLDDGVRCYGHGGGAPGMNGDLQICDSGYTIAVLANFDPPIAGRVLRFIKQRLPKS